MPPTSLAAAPTVALVSAGAMGAQIGAALVSHGACVLTSVESRSRATRERALRARLQLAPLARLGTADVLLSVVPSDQALAVADALLAAGALRRGLLYVDCNPLSPGSLARLAERLAQVGCSLVDACILGGSPRPGASPAPRLCVGGPRAAELDALNAYGVEVQQLAGPLGTASALRSSISGISKGVVALATLLIARAPPSVLEPLRIELARTHSGLLQWVERQSERLPSEARRWASELREVSTADAPFPGQAVLAEIADYFEGLASAPAGPPVTAALDRFFGRTAPSEQGTH